MVNQRSYQQYCPIAHSLDLIGDRWTLLIIRDLVLGPKRFRDLVAGLPGIGTNLLTERLKQLEHGQILRRRLLPAPASVQVYELTEYGMALEGPLVALAQWGAQSLGSYQPGQVISRDTILLTARALLRHLPAQPGVTYQFILADTASAGDQRPYLLHCQQEQNTMQIAVVDSPQGHAFVQITSSIATLYQVAGGLLDLAEATDRGDLLISAIEPAAPHTN